MVSCTKCGKENEDGSKSCSNCGAALTKNNAAENSKKHSKYYINSKAIILGLAVFIVTYFIANNLTNQYKWVISGLLTGIAFSAVVKNDREFLVNAGIFAVFLIIFQKFLGF
ncbi:zinc-ribbon domain-containing protein [Methanobacterium sp.]|uniref:zinc ribbon domain-containing protein n=1 Tax=Methanobacterium sp. TaxID=2164 RepID=UPI003C750AEA